MLARGLFHALLAAPLLAGAAASAQTLPTDPDSGNGDTVTFGVGVAWPTPSRRGHYGTGTSAFPLR